MITCRPRRWRTFVATRLRCHTRPRSCARAAATELGQATRAASDRRPGARRPTRRADPARRPLCAPGPRLPGRRRHPGADEPVLRARTGSGPTGRTSSNIGCTLNAAAQLEARLKPSPCVAGHGCRSWVTASAACWRAASPYAGRTWSPTSSRWAARCWRPALTISLAATVDLLVRLSRAGIPGLMSAECVSGDCARQSFSESRGAVPDGVGFTAIYSRRDGIVDWRAPASTRWHGPSRSPRPTSAWPSTPAWWTRSAVPRTAAAAPQLSKSIAAKARSFCSWCSEVIERIVPLRERITSECVVAPPPR